MGKRKDCFVRVSTGEPRTLGGVSDLCCPRGGHSENQTSTRDSLKSCRTAKRVPWGTELGGVSRIEGIRIPPILRPSESVQDSVLH